MKRHSARANRASLFPYALLAASVLSSCGAPPPDAAAPSPGGPPPSREAPTEPTKPAATAAPAAASTSAAEAPPAPDPLIAGLTRAIADRPDDGPLIYMLAARHAERGEKKEALRWLERLVEIKWTFIPDEIDFAALKDDPAYREIGAKLAKNEPVVSRSSPAFSLPEKDFIPEGIAYDPKERTFYLGSLYKRKIVAVGKDKAARDFTSEGQDGLFAVLGMKVDAARRHLWVASVAFPTMKGFTPDMNGKAALFHYDLGARKLIAKLEPPSTGAPSLLNDIAINAKGDVFVTDSERGGVYIARKGEGKLTDLVPPDKFRYPNGIVLSKDEKSLFVAHFRGISRVNAATGEEARLEAAKGVVLAGIDGMALYEGSLVAVQNGFSRGRITRFFLDKAGGRVEREEILESGSPLVALPTTGAVADGAFYYIANSQLRSFDADKRILPLDALKESVVLKAPLGR